MKEFLEMGANLVTIVGIISFWFAIWSWKNDRNTFHHSVITSCTNRFQELINDLMNPEISVRQARQYLELCNEELFYFENNYLPRAVMLEWIDGMLSVIPLRKYDSKGLLNNSSEEEFLNLPNQSQPAPFFKRPELWELLTYYPRLNHVFTLKSNDEKRILRAFATEDPNKIKEEMLRSILRNIRSYRSSSPFKPLLKPRFQFWL